MKLPIFLLIYGFTISYSTKLSALENFCSMENSVGSEFILVPSEIDNINNLLSRLNNKENINSIKEKFINIRQPKGSGGTESIRADKRNANKIISHEYRIYTYKKNIKLVKTNDQLVVFWFLDNNLKKITSNCPEICVPKFYLDISTQLR